MTTPTTFAELGVGPPILERLAPSRIWAATTMAAAARTTQETVSGDEVLPGHSPRLSGRARRVKISAP